VLTKVTAVVTAPRTTSGTTRIGADLTLSKVLALGPQLLGVLADLPGAVLPNEQCVHSGAFIDVPAKTVHLWAGADSPEPPTLATHWPVGALGQPVVEAANRVLELLAALYAVGCVM
jgi:hypothetical protein